MKMSMVQRTLMNQDPAYSVWKVHPGEGMAVLRTMFPQGVCDEMNLVLFSTSGTHGTGITIEDAELHFAGKHPGYPQITFLIIHPRLVCMKYGVCEPRNAEDLLFLKSLRCTGRAAMMCIGGRE